MKKFVSVLALLVFAAGTASAATVYTLTSVYYGNSFTGANKYFIAPTGSYPFTLNGNCTGCLSSTLTDDGAGNLTIVGAAWNVNTTSGSPTTYTTSWDGTAVLGGNTVARTSLSCVDSVGTTCSNNIAGIGVGDWKATGLGQDGTTACTVCNTQVIDGSTINVPGTIFVTKTYGLTPNPIGTSFQKITLQYNQVVPVPAAVWLFGSALGLLGLSRRRAA